MNVFRCLVLITFFPAMRLAGQEVSGSHGCPVRTSSLRDGGSVLIEVPGWKGSPGFQLFEDHRLESLTPGQYYSRSPDAADQRTPMTADEVLRAFGRIESILIETYGKEEIFRLAMNPMVVGASVPAEEYQTRMTDAAFMEKIEISELLEQIHAYRKEHAASSPVSGSGR